VHPDVAGTSSGDRVHFENLKAYAFTVLYQKFVDLQT
jgi:hypothetical protein